ncbi:hypothetical protein L218DRAFT_80360 [Marasmius fiardii PR-910]|nr:hypothetical protein L218DRAFT_80360 [Marasmius fiardii PR-910]
MIFCHGVELPQEVRHKLSTTFRSITSFSLFESTLLKRSLTDDIEFVCSFKELTTILFYGHHRHEMKIDSDVELPANVHTLKLDLPSAANEAVFRWLLSHHRIPAVSTLRIFRVTDDTNPALQAYLQACKGNLTDLMLFLYQCRTDPEFDFSQHTSLKNIYLNLNGTTTTHSAQEILSTTRLSSLENIILRISVYELAEVENWAMLDELLTSELFPKSMKVTIVIDEHGTYEDKMKERLTRCVTSGQLDIVYAGVPSIASSYVDEVYSRMKNF